MKTPNIDMRLLGLLQLASPTLPVGAFAFSQGMEHAVAAGWITNEAMAKNWITGSMIHCMARLDIPILIRMSGALVERDKQRFAEWNGRLYAGRGTAEFQAEDRHMGQALARLLIDLDLINPAQVPGPHPTFAAMFAEAAACWGIETDHACAGYLWSWMENQVAAAVKLVPLGQTAGQRILLDASSTIADAVRLAASLDDHEIGAAAPGLAIAGALHETQHCRLFRS